MNILLESLYNRFTILVSGMVTGRQCSWHTGRNKLKLGSEIQNALLNSREQALQGEKAKLTNNGCTCCKFISPSSSSSPASHQKKEIKVRGVCTSLTSRCMISKWFQNFKQLPPAVPSRGFKSKDASCAFKQSGKKFQILQIMFDCSQVNLLLYLVFLALFSVPLIVVLRSVMCWKQKWLTVM